MSKRSTPRYFSIGHVAEVTDLPTSTLRYWEKQFRQLSPRKSRTGRRMYTESDITLVRQIKNLLHERRFTIDGAKDVLDRGDGLRPVIMPKEKEEKAEEKAPPAKTARELMLERKLARMRRLLQELVDLL